MPAQRETGKERRECLDMAASSRAFADDKCRHRQARPPAQLARDERSIPSFDVEPTEQSLGVHDRGLDLDHEQILMARVMGEQVDAATVAVG